MPVWPHSWSASPAQGCWQMFLSTPCPHAFLPPTPHFHFQAMNRVIKAPYMFFKISVYLQTTPETCYQRLKMRCREEEKVIPLVRAPLTWGKVQLHPSLAPPSVRSLCCCCRERNRN